MSGAPWNPLVLGKHSGRHAVQKRCAELGFEIEGDELMQVYRALMAIADDRKTITDNDIRTVVAGVRTQASPGARRRSIRSTHRPRPCTSPHEAGYGHGVYARQPCTQGPASAGPSCFGSDRVLVEPDPPACLKRERHWRRRAGFVTLRPRPDI